MHICFRKSVLVGLLCASSLAAAADWAMGSSDWASLPEQKRTKLGLYLTPKEALARKQQASDKVALFDIRTRAEAMYVGMPSDVDALVPYVEHQEVMAEWDSKRGAYVLEPNADFVPELERRLKARGLGKDATIILICRSGDRSARAADLLMMSGYQKVYSVTEGFEGDTAKEGAQAGQRVVNGWKNSGLPWSYKLDKAKMYFPPN